MSEIVIKTRKLSKTYDIFFNNRQKIKSLLLKSPSPVQKEAIKKLDLTIKKGERVAIMGNVGSGRSTLMKMLSRIIFPTSGEVEINGKITNIFDLRTGFDGALTGLDNLYIRGAFIGLSKEQLKEKEAEIIEFSGLGDIINMPMKSWKAGSSSVLSVSIYLAFKPDILLIDDSLSVRDKFFKARMMKRFQEFFEDGETTMLIVTNQIPMVKGLCTRAIILDEGEIIFDGEPVAALKEYKKYAKKANAEVEKESDIEEEEEDDDDFDDF